MGESEVRSDRALTISAKMLSKITSERKFPSAICIRGNALIWLEGVFRRRKTSKRGLSEFAQLGERWIGRAQCNVRLSLPGAPGEHFYVYGVSLCVFECKERGRG